MGVNFTTGGGGGVAFLWHNCHCILTRGHFPIRVKILSHTGSKQRRKKRRRRENARRERGGNRRWKRRGSKRRKEREQSRSGDRRRKGRRWKPPNPRGGQPPSLDVHQRRPKPNGEKTQTTPRDDTKNKQRCPLPGTDPELDHVDLINAGERSGRNPRANRHQSRQRTHRSTRRTRIVRLNRTRKP